MGSFAGSTQYFTGQNKPGQADGTSFPGPAAVGTSPGTLGFVANLAPLRIQNDVIWDMLYAADNEGATSGNNSTVNNTASISRMDEVHPTGYGKVRTINLGLGPSAP